MIKHRKPALPENWKVVVAKTFTEIEAIRPIWEQLQRSQFMAVVSSDIDRYLSLVKPLSDDIQPYIMLLYRNSHPVAMVIGYIEARRLNCKFGYKTLFRPSLQCLSVVYGGFLGNFTEEVSTIVVQELMNNLSQRKADVVFFNNLRIDLPVYQKIRQMPSRLCRSNFSKVETHWRMTIPKSIDLFYQSCSPKSRNTLRRKVRKLEKEFRNQVRIVTYRGEHELEEAISAASQISRGTYQHGLGVGFEDNARTRSMMATAVNRGWLRMSVLYVKSEPSAFQLGLQYRNGYFLRQMGFNPKWKQWNVGSVLFLKVLEDICNKAEVESFDFGFGDADYKRFYGNEHWNEACVYIYAPRFYPVLVNLLQTSVTGLSVGTGRVLEKTGLLRRVKRRWRNRLQKE